jgi:hypothetical protein
MVTRAPSPH